MLKIIFNLGGEIVLNKSKGFKNLSLVAIIVGMLFIFLGLGSSNSHVEAAAWHKGTPKVIRGKYKTHHYDADLMSTFTIRKSSITAWQSGMSPIYGSKVKYKCLGKNKYMLKYTAKSSMALRKFTEKVKFQKIGKRYKISFANHWFYKY